MAVEMQMLSVLLVICLNLEKNQMSNFVESEKQVHQFIPVQKLAVKIYRIPNLVKEAQ